MAESTLAMTLTESIQERPFNDTALANAQTAVIKDVLSAPEKYLSQYENHPQSFGGLYVCADLFKELFDVYRTDKHSRTRFNAAVHNSAAVLASAQLQRILQKLKNENKPLVVLLTGMPGAGKTTSALHNGIPKGVHAVYEGQMADPKNAIDKVQKIIDAGFKPHIRAILTTPEKAFERTLQRHEEIGRGASIEAIARIQGGLATGLTAVLQQFGDNVKISVVDRRQSVEIRHTGAAAIEVLKSEGNYEHIRIRLHRYLTEKSSTISDSARAEALSGSRGDGLRAIAPSGGQNILGSHGRSVGQRKLAPRTQQETLLDEPQRVALALTYLPAHDRATWVNAAFAIKNSLGEAGLSIWDAWSQTSPSYNKASAKEVWRSAKSMGKTIASLYYLARQNGFDPRQHRSNPNQPTISAEVYAARLEKETQEQASRHFKAAQLANTVFSGLSPAQHDHPYLVRKQVTTTHLHEVSAKKLAALIGYTPKNEGIPLSGQCLVVRVQDAQGKTTTLEFIDELGRKTALRGGKKSSCFVSLVEKINPNADFVIAEGVATACSIQHALPQSNVLAALSDTNLMGVAKAIRATYPNARIIVAPDLGSINKGVDVVNSVERCTMITPKFTDQEIALGNSDFNDMQVLGRDLSQSLQLLHQDFGHSGQNDQAASLAKSLPIDGHFSNPSRRTAMQDQNDQGQNQSDVGQPDKAQFQPKKVGDWIRPLNDIPQEIRQLAKLQFGLNTEISPPRANGDYKGEIYNAENYFLQEVGPRNVVIHDKRDVELVGDHLHHRDQNKKLNGYELQIHYGGKSYDENQQLVDVQPEKAKAYTYDRQKDELEKAVGSLKKSMKELNMGDAFPKALDQAKEQSLSRFAEIRTQRIEAITQAKEARAQNKDKPQR